MEQILEKLSPSTIAVEMSAERESLLTSTENVAQIIEDTWTNATTKHNIVLSPEKRETLKEIYRVLGSICGFELRTSKDYVKSHPNCNLEYMDLSLFGGDVSGYNTILPIMQLTGDDDRLSDFEAVKLTQEEFDNL